MERLEIGMLHPIFATQLFDDELGIQAYREAADFPSGCRFESDHERGPLRDVVGLDPKVRVRFLDQLPIGIEEDGAARGRPRVAPRAAVCEEGRLGRPRGKQRLHQVGFRRTSRMNRPQDGEEATMGYVLSRAAAAAFFAGMLAATSSSVLAASTFYGIVVHVSTQNIKVQDSRTKQILSFTIVPKFDQVFSANGKTTYQMSAIKAGQYVGIIYDQKALGVRHADKIYLLNNANQRIGTQ